MDNFSFAVTVKSYAENLDEFGLVESVESDVSTEPCELSVSGDFITVAYKTKSEGGAVETEISVGKSIVKLTRRGAIRSVMEFSLGEPTKTLYEIPPYSFDAEIDTRKINSSLGAGGGTVELLYYLTIGGAKKKMRLSLTVVPSA